MAGLPVVAGFATHPDWDHALWHPDHGDAPRYGTARCAAEPAQLRADPAWADHVAQALPPEFADEPLLDGFGLVTGLDGDAVPWDGPTVRVVEHPAHSPGHAALLVEDRGVLIGGDMLSDVFPPMLDVDAGDDPIADYRAGLDRLAGLLAAVEIVVPGHGFVGRGEEIRDRVVRDRAYLDALQAGRTPQDPRLGPDVAPGWEWVNDVHESQAAALAGRFPGLSSRS